MMKKPIIICCAVLLAVAVGVFGALALLPGMPAYLAAKTLLEDSEPSVITEYEHYGLEAHAQGIQTVTYDNWQIDILDSYKPSALTQGSEDSLSYQRESDTTATLLISSTGAQASPLFSDNLYTDAEKGINEEESAEYSARMKQAFEKRFDGSADSYYRCVKAALSTTADSFKLSDDEDARMLLTLCYTRVAIEDTEAVYSFVETDSINGIIAEHFYESTGRTLITLQFTATDDNIVNVVTFVCDGSEEILEAHKAINSIRFI